MAGDLNIIEGEYLRDILDQPSAIDATVTELQIPKTLDQVASRIRKGKFRTIVLTGMGSSLHALHPLNLELIKAGVAAVMVETSELLHHQARLFDPKNLIVAVSQSGQSAEVVRLLQMNRGRSAVIGVTNTPESALGKRADACVVTCAGKEFSVSCKTYVSTLVALNWLADVICGRDLRRTRRELASAAPAFKNYLQDWKKYVEILADRLAGMRQLFLVGRGPSLAAVGTGALIVKEADHFPAEGMSSAAFRHGPFEMIKDQTFVGVFAGSRKTYKLNRTLFEDIRSREGEAEWIGADSEFPAFRLPKAPESIVPVLEILPVQMVTLALAARVGREAGRFSFCSKVTTTE